MITLKLRLEAELEKGDACASPTAIAEALESAAKQIREQAVWVAQNIIDVPRGRLVYDVIPRR